MWSKPSIESVGNCSVDNFMKAVQLAYRKPQVLTKALCGAQILQKYTTTDTVDSSIIMQLVEKLQKTFKLYLEHHDLRNWDQIISNAHDWFSDVLSKFIPVSILDDVSDGHGDSTLLLQHALPKNTSCAKMINFYIISSGSMICIPLLLKQDDSFKISTQVTYKIQYTFEDPSKVLLNVWTSTDVPLAMEKMDNLSSFFYKFIHYCSLELSDTCKQSLQLVNLDHYNDLYNKLKTKYAEFLISNWSERTDAQKFVYEDIAIATYIMMLFEQEREELGLEKKQSFLDIGCGNGLLVYLLTREGYRGTGYDIRRRKIWDWYGDVDLQEKTIVPSCDLLFPEYDWLIGNHSDEMTPWIPVISARSGYHKRFLVLPCCPHDFNGKFRERKSNRSVYQVYLDYVEEIVDTCGFIPERDVLKIPSTKRTCIIGRRRNYKQNEETEVEKRRTAFIQYRCQRLLTKNGVEMDENVAENIGFVPRPKEERVRNCTQLDRDLKSRMVTTVFLRLLTEKNMVRISDSRSWNCGTAIALSELVKLFDRETLKEMKNECGGLQTLLRNHHQIFMVAKGMVSLRYDDMSRMRNKSDQYYKTCLCYFHEHHPDGCWQSHENCSYAHGADDLREFERSKNTQK